MNQNPQCWNRPKNTHKTNIHKSPRKSLSHFSFRKTSRIRFPLLRRHHLRCTTPRMITRSTLRKHKLWRIARRGNVRTRMRVPNAFRPCSCAPASCHCRPTFPPNKPPCSITFSISKYPILLHTSKRRRNNHSHHHHHQLCADWSDKSPVHWRTKRFS